MNNDIKRPLVCSCCGQTIDLDHYDQRKPAVKEMKERQLCFNCLFWENYISDPNPDPDLTIVNGMLMRFVPIRRPMRKHTQARKGMWLAREMRTGEVVGNMDRHIIGTVPKHFRKRLPDKFRLISLETYRRIKDRKTPYCILKGCVDRYRCFWYNAKKTEPDGPWNKQPRRYKVGMEECESFIDKKTMYDVNPD